MAKLRGILAWALSLTALIGGGTAFAAAPAAPNPQTEVQQASASLTAQLNREAAGLRTTEVYVNGQGPFNFIIDTGANRSVVSRSLAALLALPPAGQDSVHGVTGVRIADMVHVDTLKADSLVLNDAKMPVLDSELLGGADGMLGMEAMAGKRLEIDNRTNQLSLQNSPRADLPKSWRRIGVTLQFGQLAVVQARIENLPVTIVIDTGAERTIANSALAAAIQQKTKRALPGTRITSAAKAVRAGDVLALPAVQLGADVSLSKTTAFVGDFHVFKLWGLENEPALLLGMDVLGVTHAFAIDYARRELQIRLF
ncbi:MAG: aspartyl protease family protein [Caulobacterales bacterium]